jgi:hypothetical protein
MSFAAVSGTAYYLRTTSGAASAPLITLYDIDGATAAGQGYGYFPWIAPADGTYYVKVTGEPGAYDVEVLTASGVAPDAYETDDAWGQAKRIVPDGASQSRTLHSLLDKDWITVEAVAGNTYYTELDPHNYYPFDSVSTVWYDTDGTTLLDSGLVCTVSGTYYVKVSRGVWFEAVGSYTISVVTHSIYALPDAFEPDNTFADATPFDLAGPPVQHTLHSSSDTDWFAVEVPAGGMTITVDTQGGGIHFCFPTVSIFDVDGTTELASGFGGATCVAPATGTYYVMVHSSPGLYYVDIEVE